MPYVPFGPDLEGVPNVIVDGAGNDATVLMLSHWPGASTPAELKADTSAEIVLNYLRSPDRESLLAGAEAVSNNHFDIDGLMGLWAMLNSEAALANADKLVAIAECGDFEARISRSLVRTGAAPSAKTPRNSGVFSIHPQLPAQGL